MTREHSLSIAILSVSLLIVVGSVVYTNRLAHDLAVEEQERVKIWAEATERLILAPETEDIDFYTTIIEHNYTIPVYIVDSMGQILYMRNVDKVADDPTLLNGPIDIRFEENGQGIVQHIYYDESSLLRQLRYVPYVQFGVFFIFIAVAVLLLISTQRSEQNRVWVGLSKETAHQLGTPISALMGWQELIAARYPEDTMLPQMKADIQRLQTIANRFSKIGSEAELKVVNVNQVAQATLDYMRARTSLKISMSLDAPIEVSARLNVPLFEWVIENLMKNAIDAMDGRGEIRLTLSVKDSTIRLDVTDTGKGIERHTLRRIFRPGFSTKSRGWGLGLSLAKRIVEDYHGGKLFVKTTELGKGTTFRIELKQAEDR